MREIHLSVVTPHSMGEEESLGADTDDYHAGVGSGEDEERLNFEPTEDELVLHYLRPQLRGFPPRVPGAVVEADPCALAPWELLARYGMRGEGYFFAPRCRRREGKRGRGPPLVRRTPARGSGSWMHSGDREEGRSMTALGVVARWSRTRYGFYVRGGTEGRRSTGWVMSEYEITDPRCYRRADEEEEEDEYWVLCHVRRSCRTSGGKPPSRRRLLVDADPGTKC